MSSSPLHPSLVHILLQYIAPPSGMAHPLPPDMISKPLLQRHHFLSLSPDMPQDYLCWPAPSERQARAIALLESLPRPVHDEPIDYPVEYTFDGENAHAHVNLTAPGDVDGARLVFQWDDADGWKYHDAGLMPFPLGSHPSVDHVSPSAHRLGSGEQPSMSSNPVIVAEGDLYSAAGKPNDSDDDDDYWNAYGSHDHDGSSPRTLHGSGKDAPASEDAYWAQYSTVHGTADSTVPSPMPQTQRKIPQGQRREGNDPYSAFPLPSPLRTGFSSQEALPIPDSALLRPNLHTKYDPASPRQLTQRLEALSMRDSRPATPPLVADGGSLTVSPTIAGSAGSERLESPPSAGWAAKMEFSRPARPSLVIQALSAATTAKVDGYGEGALRESVKGIWKLWKAGRQSGNDFASEVDDRESFLAIVRDTIENC